MLLITVPITKEGWDEEKEEFLEPKTVTLQLEHSLIAISRWESKWNKPFFSKQEKTDEEAIDYIRCMTLTKNVDQNVYYKLTANNFQAVNTYIESPMTATTFSDDKTRAPNRQIVTSELIYYWMIANNIPFECEKWHINRLLTLIQICGIKNSPPKKMSQRELMRRNSSLNAARRHRTGSKG